MRALLVGVPLIFLVGCTSANMMVFNVVSEPPGAQVDVNGMTMGKTPTDITLQCSKTWVGVMNSPDGWDYGNSFYEVVVYPSSSKPGYSQTKRVNPCQWKGQQTGLISFDLGLEKVSPTQKLEIIGDSIPRSNKQNEAIQNLRKLRDQQILSEEEYKEKVLIVIEQNDK